MHTARQLDQSLFELRIDGKVASREDLLPNWTSLDRIGVVVTAPYGAVGACHLIQLAITAFYDIRPTRQAGLPRTGDPLAIYPEVYLFHVGGRFGDHSHLDVWPARKEVFVDSDARAVLDALNDRGITCLAVPEGEPLPVEHEWKEPATAMDRISSAYIYSPTGRVQHADVEIRGLSSRTEMNARRILDPGSAGGIAKKDPYSDADDPILRQRSWGARIRARADESRGGLEEARARRSEISQDDTATETYRRTSVETALQMLAPRVDVPPLQSTRVDRARRFEMGITKEEMIS